MSGFEVGDTVRIDDMNEAGARSVFGDAIYEAWLAHKGRPVATFTITSVDGDSLCLCGPDPRVKFRGPLGNLRPVR